jgi:hypothetical protein
MQRAERYQLHPAERPMRTRIRAGRRLTESSAGIGVKALASSSAEHSLRLTARQASLATADWELSGKQVRARRRRHRREHSGGPARPGGGGPAAPPFSAPRSAYSHDARSYAIDDS